jgi:MFS transporter, DHA2 family, multidrug resistance protein
VNFGIAIFIAQYLQLVHGLSPLAAGLWTVPYAAAFIVGALLTPLSVRRIRPGLVIAGGLTLAGAGFALLTQVHTDSALAILVTGSVVFALGLAPVYTLAADMMVGAAPPERAGGAAGISETSSEFGGALGIAVLGAAGTAVYRGQIDDAVPSGVTPEAAEAARDTLGGAVAAGDELGDRLALALVDAAREAFTQALQLAATLSAAVAIGAAILTAALLRRPPMRSEPEQERGLEAACRPC